MYLFYFQDNIACMQERLSYAKTVDGFMARVRGDNDEDVNVATNGQDGDEGEEEEEGKSPADSLISEKDRQDLEAALINIEGKKRQTEQGFARNKRDRFEHQMTSSAPPAMALPRRRSSIPHQYQRTKEIASLKRQLAELQSMVDTYERTSTPRNNRLAISAAGLADNGSTISDMSFTESRHHHRVKGADSLLAEMSEQLHLQKELHLRRKDLEKLMKKDMMENIQKEHDEADDEDDMSMTRTSSDVRSDASLGGRHGMRRRRRGGGPASDHVNVRMAAGSLGAWLDGSLVNGIAPVAPANHYRRLRQRSLSSNNSLSGFALEPASAAAAQIQILQRQVDKLQMEIGVLNQTATLQQQQQHQQRRMNGSSVDFLESASTMAAAAVANNLRQSQSPSEDDVRLQLQQHQIQLLTQSLTQCFQTLLSVQQDVSLLQCTVEKLVEHQHDLAQHQQQQQVSNSSSVIGIGQPQQQSANAPQLQGGNSPSARQPQSSLRMDNLSRGRGFENWQPNIAGETEFVPILPMPASIAVTNAEQHQQQHRSQSLGFAASSSDHGNVTAAAVFPDAIMGVGPPIEANNTQWIGAPSQSQETMIAAHPAPPLASVDDMGLWSLQQHQTQQALSLRNGLNQWSGEANIRPPPPPDHDNGHQRPTPVALNNQQPTPVALNNTADNWRSLFRQNRLSNGGSAAAAAVTLPPFALQQPTVVSSSNGPQGRHPQQQHQQHPMGSTAPNVAQVTPRQVMACTKRPTCMAAPVAVTMSSSAAPPTSATAFIEPNFGPVATAARGATAPRSRTSPPRPRRKQKINREQNRENATPILPVEANNSFANGSTRSTASRRQRSAESSSSGNTSVPPTSASAAMVFPIQQQQQQEQNRNLNSNSQQAATAADHANPVVNSLSRSIYDQVSHLISQHEQRPDQLARIFEDLQALSRNSLEVAVNDTSAQVVIPDGAAGVWRYHTPNSQASAIDQLQSLDSPKVNGKFSFNTIRDGERPQPLANDGRRQGGSEQNQQPVAIGSMQPFHNRLSEMSAIMEGPASNGNEQRHSMQSEVAVPKNIKRNQRDGRKVGPAATTTAAATTSVGIPFNNDRKSKPRNMQQFGPAAAGAAVDPILPPSAANSPENIAVDEAAFVSVPIKFHPRIYAANREAVSNNDVDAESEMAEADQDHSSPDRSADFLPQADFHTPDAPDSMTSAEDAHARADDAAAAGAVGGSEEIPEAPAPAALRLLLHGDEAEAGLDRVPTRLAPTELNAQIAAEETENERNLVEEVLESSELPESVEQSVSEPQGDDVE